MSDESHAIATHFGGDAQLYHGFRHDCLRQFADDLSACDAHVAAAETRPLRLMVHNLKTVLLVLGEDELSACARRLEQHLAPGPWPDALPDWPLLRAGLQRLISD